MWPDAETASPFELLKMDSPVRDEEVDTTSTQAGLESAVSCLRSVLRAMGCQLPEGQPISADDGESSYLALMVSSAVDALGVLGQDRDRLEDMFTRLQSDYKILESGMTRVEEKAECKDRELGFALNKMHAMEARHVNATKQDQDEKLNLQRQLRDAHRRQHQGELAMRRKESEVEQLQRQLQNNSQRSNLNGGQSSRRQTSDTKGAQGIPSGPQRVNTSSTTCDYAQHQQHVLNLEGEVQHLRLAEAKLEYVLSRAEALGFGPALQMSPTTSRGPLQDITGKLPHNAFSKPSCLEQTPQGVREFTERSVPAIHDACQRWLAYSKSLVEADSFRPGPEREQLLKCVVQSRQLMQQQQVALESAVTAYRNQQERAEASEARGIALEARIDAVLQHPAVDRSGKSAQLDYLSCEMSPTSGQLGADPHEGRQSAAAPLWGQRPRALSAPGTSLNPKAHDRDRQRMPSHQEASAAEQGPGCSAESPGQSSPMQSACFSRATPKERKLWASSIPVVLASPLDQLRIGTGGAEAK